MNVSFYSSINPCDNLTLPHLLHHHPGALSTVSAFMGAEPPLKLGPGEWFISQETVQAMGGDLSRDICWRGDNNGWGKSFCKVITHQGQKGILISNTGPEAFRFNLYQDPAGWLPIEAAFDVVMDPFVYHPGKHCPGKSYDCWRGKGPAFWGVGAE